MEHESSLAKPPVTSRPQLSEDEVTWAFVIGGGMLLVMLALGLNAIQGTGNSNALSVILPIGGLLMIGGIIGWMAEFRPWRKYDDLSTPFYTGHTDHDSHETPPEHQKQQIEPALTPPVIDDPIGAFSPEGVQNEPPVTPPVIVDPTEAFSPEEAPAPAPNPRKPRAKKAQS